MYHSNKNVHSLTVRPENNNSDDNNEVSQTERPPPCTQKDHEPSHGLTHQELARGHHKSFPVSHPALSLEEHKVPIL